VVTELQRLFGLGRPGWRLLHCGWVVVCSAASRICHFPGHHLVSRYLRLGKLTERDLFFATQAGIVRVALVPADELVRLLADARVIPSPRLVLAIIHTVADRPGYYDLAGQTFTSSLPLNDAGKNVEVFIDSSHHFSPSEKKPALDGTQWLNCTLHAWRHL
jgi:hypothetical protein